LRKLKMSNGDKNNKQFFRTLKSLKLGLGDIVEDKIKKGESLDDFMLSLKFQGNYRDEDFEEFLDPYLSDIDVIPYGTFIADTYDFSDEFEVVVLSYHFRKSRLYRSVYECDEGEDIRY